MVLEPYSVGGAGREHRNVCPVSGPFSGLELTAGILEPCGMGSA